MKRIEFIIILVLVIIIGGSLYWLTRDTHVEGVNVGQTQLSPTQIRTIENIGQWEFLSISDEELIDTTRNGFFGDDKLVRIYYGTLRLGIDMKEVKEGWIETEKDTIVCTLPPIKLLDHNFIDEAKTQSFFERAYNAMRIRCLSNTNISTAEENAQIQFYKMLKAMGFTNVKVRFEEEHNK